MGAPHQNDTNLTINLLGGFSAQKDGSQITGFESDRVRALLAYLVLESARPQQRGLLAGLFWPEQTEKRARQNLSQALYNLRVLLEERAAIQPLLIVTKNVLQLSPNSRLEADVIAFEALLSRYKAHAHQDLVGCDACLGRLDQALGLYQGEFLAGFALEDSSAFEEWCLVTREQLHRQALHAAHVLFDCRNRRGQTEAALELAWRWVVWNPYSETAHRALLSTLAASGRHGQALAEYHKFCRLLADELSIEPNRETTALYERIRSEATALTDSAEPPHNLPPSLTPFVGRNEEIRQLATRLRADECRLLSIVGPGGSGKTSLAIQTARTLISKFPNGVYFVPLGALGSAAGIPHTLAEALEISRPDDTHPEAQTLDYLRDKHLLLVLDGMEGLLDGVGLIERLLQAASGIKILVTSRVRLNAQFENRYALSGLGVPADTAEPAAALASEAVQLFLSGAVRAQPSFSLPAGAVGQVVRICRLVQGMPLGILLASAWVALLSPAEIAARLQDNLDFLVVDWQDLPERLRSLRATFNYSWNLLTERERGVLQSLAVFRAGFSLQAAEQVVGSTARELLRLMDKSLLQRTPSGRFEVHDLVRQYAAEKLSLRLSAELAIRDHHCAYYLELARKAEADLKGTRQAETLRNLDLEAENLRQAWRWAVENGRVDLISAALNGLCLHYELRGHYEAGLHACHLAVEKLGSRESEEENYPGWLEAHTWEFYFNCLLNHSELAQAMWEQLQRHYTGTPSSGPDLRASQALAWFGRGRLEKELFKQRDHLQRGLELFHALGEDWWAARMLMLLGLNYSRQGDYPLAIRTHEDSLALRRALGIPGEIADALRQLSYAHAFHGRLELALNLMQEAAGLYKSLGTPYGEASAARHLGMISGWHGRIADSRTLLEKSLPFYQQIGLRLDGIVVYAALSLSKMHLGEIDSARKDAQIAIKDARQLGASRELAVSLLVMGFLDLVQGEPVIALENIQEGVAIYREMGYSNELDYGLAYLGFTLREVGETQMARVALCEALTLVQRRGGGYLGLWIGLPLGALLLLDAGELEQALEAWTLACQLPLVVNSHWIEQVVGHQIQVVAGALPPEQRAAAEQRGSQRDPFQGVSWLIDILACEAE
ncbi:MAG TPA: BTAD domain-containing putative transcriptional regulator [Anaerolineales bacterium]|nr:BTAD domain-containing putative transcriptional regulator [Anaerolineales bacterium]